MQLPIDEFNGYLEQVFKMLKRDSGGGGGVATTDHRSFVEEQMRRLHG